MSAVDSEDQEEEEGTSPLEWARFAVRAARRRRRLSVAVFIVAAALTVAAVVLWPRTFTTDSKITVERNVVMPAIADPHRSIPVDYDAPTKGAVDTIYAHENLEKLVRETNLVTRWRQNRPPILRAKDAVVEIFRTPPTDADRERALVAMLEKQLHVTVDATSVTISVDWSDAQTAFDIVAAVEKSFLDARRAVEVNVISEAIAILEQHANDEGDNAAVALAEMQRLSDLRAAAQPRPVPGALPRYYAPHAASTARPAGSAGAPANDDLLRQLETKRRAIKDIEDARARRLSELNGQLVDLRATLAPAHPAVIEIERKIDAARAEPPELVTLRNEERDLLSQIAAANAVHGAAANAGNQGSQPQQPPRVNYPNMVPTEPRPGMGTTEIEDGDDVLIDVQRQKLQAANIKYRDLMDRIDSGRIELETARAAFKYRYTVVIAPEVSKAPKKPNVPLVGLGGFLLALLLAFAIPMGADLWTGRIVEAWQAEKALKLPVLGEVTRV